MCTHFRSIHFGSYKCDLWRIYASRMEEVSYRKLLKSPENRQILDWSQRRESRPLWWESIAATAKICVQCLAGSACTGPRGYRHRTRTFRRIHPREFLVILATGLNHSYRICFLIIYEDCFFLQKVQLPCEGSITLKRPILRIWIEWKKENEWAIKVYEGENISSLHVKDIIWLKMRKMVYNNGYYGIHKMV